MGHVTYIAVLTLLYLQWGDSATPIPNGKEYVFSYTGVVDAKNSENDDFASQWSIAAKLVMQSKGDDIVMKFKDMVTNLYNGDVEDFKKDTEKSIPVEAHHLYLPFVVHYHTNGSAASISLQPNDPLWSINMKRAISSIIQMDTEHVAHLHGHKFFEESIYGSCEAEYSVTEADSVKTVTKTLKDYLEKTWSSSQVAPSIPNDFHSTSTVAERSYRFAHRDNVYLLEHIESHSNITYQTMHCERSSLQLIQRQVFHLVSESAITEPIDVTKNTESTSLEYFFDDDDETSGRKEKKKIDSEKLMTDLKEYYEQFQKDFHRYPLVPGDIGHNNTIDSMFATLADMDEDSIDMTALGVILSGDEEMQSIFMTMLPYIGTNETIEIMRSVLEADILNDLVAIKVMAVLPKFTNEYTPALLKKMDVLMDLKNAENQYVKHAAIMCFAAMVAEANTRADIPDKVLAKYYKKYTKHFEGADDYETKMTYLLGLINMGSLLDSDIMISIIADKEQSYHIRSLATYGFKPYLTSNPEKMFENLWHIVRNQSEYFEVRVAVLDLLISSDLTQAQFRTIFEEFTKSTVDPYETHLQNYVSTSISSLKNETMYTDYLGAMIAQSSDTIDIPSYDDAWSTGNYRISYTDSLPNFGSYFQARLVGNPITNALAVIQLSYNHFAMSMNLGTYTAYIKLDGVADLMFVQSYLKDRPDHEIGIPQLVEMLKQLNFKLVKNADIHVEVVLFADDRVVFGMHINKENVEKITENPLFMDLLKLLVDYEFVSYPKMHVGDMRTDLGTHVRTYLCDTRIVSHKMTTDMDQLFDDTDIKTAVWNYRSSRYDFLTLESYNPLLDVDIGVYKYKSWGQRVNLSMALNVTGEYFTFDNEDDAFNLVSYRSLGITVSDEDILEKYCTTCDSDIELPTPPSTNTSFVRSFFGFKLNVTAADIIDSADLFASVDAYKSNSEAVPLAEPLLMILYRLDYTRYIDSETSSISVRSQALYEEPTENVLEWNFDIEDVYDENDPINGTDLHASLKLSCRRKHDAKVLKTLGIQYSYMDGPVSTTKGTAAHVEQRHKFRAHYSADTNEYITCFDREFKYPSRRSDICSVSPVEPAKGKGRFSFGKLEKPDTCSNQFSIAFSDIFDSTDEQIKKVKLMDEYKQCKKDSVGFKYTPATVACSMVHAAVSTYSNYTFFLDLKNAGELSEIDAQIRTSDRGFKLFEVNYVHDEVVRASISKDFLLALPMNIEEEFLNSILEFETSLGVFSGVEDPTSVAYGGYDVEVGISSTCDITPSTIHTFTEQIIEEYKSEDGKEIVAYIESIDESRGGLTVQKFSDKKIGFTMWSGNDKLVASVSGDKLNLVLNGNELHAQHTSDEHFKVYFLEDDVIYITNQIVEVYYNTEYITIKAPFLYNNYIGGLCAHEDRRITDTDNHVK